MTPPDEPSRDIASASAAKRTSDENMAEDYLLGTLTVLHELHRLLLAPAVTVGGVAVSIDVSRAGSYTPGSCQFCKRIAKEYETYRQ